MKESGKSNGARYQNRIAELSDFIESVRLYIGEVHQYGAVGPVASCLFRSLERKLSELDKQKETR